MAREVGRRPSRLTSLFGFTQRLRTSHVLGRFCLVDQHIERHAQYAGEIPKKLGLVNAAFPPADDHDGHPDCLRGVIGAARSRSSRRSRRGAKKSVEGGEAA